jgi:Bacterial PH domain
MAVGFILGTGLLLLIIALFWSQPGVNNVGATAIMAVGLWFIWASGWWTKIVVTGHGVLIDNVFFQHVIPWSAFVDFSVDNGLVARLSDGTRVPVTSFGGSLVGALTQYRGLSKKRDALMAACSEHSAVETSASGPYHRLIRLHSVALLVYVLPLVGIAVGIDTARHVL